MVVAGVVATRVDYVSQLGHGNASTVYYFQYAMWIRNKVQSYKISICNVNKKWGSII